MQGDEDHPESPDVFYWYDSRSQTIPLALTVERRSGAQFEILDVSPSSLAAGSQDNVVRVRIKNVGHDTAKDLVARIRPESGLYVSVDESPVAALPPQQEDRIGELLEMVDLSEHRGRLAGALSGGMYQRLSLACTLIHEPQLLLLDEPTVGVDPRLRQTFWEYFGRLAGEGKTVLITTHLMDEAEKCQMVGYMRAGRMAAQGTPEEILRLAGLRSVLKLWLAEPERDAALLRAEGYEIDVVGGVVQVSLESHSRIKEVLAAVSPLDMRLTEPKLAEAFLLFSEAA